MKIERLTLENFRNAKQQSLVFSDGVNLIYGKNAAGKTNALEAIYLFATCKSFRTFHEADFIRRNENFCRIGLEYVDEAIPFEKRNMSIEYFDKKKLLKYEGVDVRRVSDFVGNFRAVLFMPDSMSVIRGAPEERRRFIDTAIMQMNSGYIKYLSNYYRILSQKNSLIKNASVSGSFDKTLLEVINLNLAHFCAIIIKQRYGFVQKIKEYAKEFYKDFSSDSQELSFKYQSILKENFEDIKSMEKELFEFFCKNFEAEKNFGSSLYGAHRDELQIYLGEEEESSVKVKSFGSQGQKRSAVLSMLLAQGEIIKDITKTYPVFLFDDVLSELDTHRKENLIKKLKDKQVIITCCEESINTMSDISNKIFCEDGKYFKV